MQIFSRAEILLPQGEDLSGWSVVACDQYTSEPDYWDRVEQRTQGIPSSSHLIIPEAYLSQPGLDGRISRVNAEMQKYLSEGLFRTLPDSYLYLERELAPGKVRHGLIGKIDLEAYDYKPGSQSGVRPTEGTVESRLPPRIRVRQDAPLELPHVMVLIDDPDGLVIEPLAAQAAQMQQVYQFTLMENGGAVRGWSLDQAGADRVDQALARLAEQAEQANRAIAPDKAPLYFAMGDGNHSLATAKACYEQLKQTLPEEEWKNHPARYALVELVNLHDAALEFEPIHRVVFGVKPQELLDELNRFCEISQTGEGQSFEWRTADRSGRIVVKNPPSQLAVGTLQLFIDRYLASHGGEVDYIHGEDTLEKLCQREDAIGFLLPVMGKDELFRTVQIDGALPRKTFSMGHAHEKRFYLECRKIR
ncbi:hypothetical protein C814_00520 [Anaerotruncus sp. G3(2012)]|uniref:DUF1015 domain-containing protein n=1 Tax=Anaerotruncus sp. G3(2012) TaxID=1235835 RepID=UPI00033D7EF2|nr:DUF1015 domain-containing protein [Anaerotruncus sp. G3(2012)]EOS64095.1 hypothetical protein C814_00520 [Anaerotruncus sp. G3(2012)]